MATATPDPKLGGAEAKGGGQTSSSRFMFVEFSAPSEPLPKGTKKRRGGPSEVRAHITKEYHRKLRVKRLGAPKATKSASSIPDGKDEEEHSGVALPERTRSASLPDSTIPLDGEDEGKNDHKKRHLHKDSKIRRASTTSLPGVPLGTDTAVKTPLTEHSDIRLSLSRSPNLCNLLGEGRLDPFNALPSQGTMPLFIHRVLEHALVHSWPNTVPARSRSNMNPVQAAWFRMAMEHPVAFHSFIYATTLHMLHLHRGNEIVADAPMLRLVHKTRTIELIKDALSLQDSHTPPSDALIMAIAILSIHGSKDNVVHPHVHPTSPLAEAQNLHVYGNMINDDTHVQWVKYMIMQKGGLEGLQLYGFADTMALCDLYFSTKHVCPPSFPLRKEPESLVLSGKHILDDISLDLDSELATGFKYFQFTSEGCELLSVLDSFSELTVALDHYARGGPTTPDLVDLVNARHAAQHRLLSQLPPPQSNFLQGDKCVLHACRLATLIFSDMVIFPLPATQGLKHRLAPLLRHTLQACSMACDWELHAYTLLWATTLGAIAATHSHERGWYVEKMIAHLRNLGIDQWSSLNSICSRFLWWKPVCEEPTETLWQEMFPTIENIT